LYFLFGPANEFSFEFRVIFSANNTPKYPKDDSGAVESRLSVFQFFRLSTKSIDMDAISKIKEEEAAHVLVYCNKIFLEEK
jgi:phage/plasmid-associated DNA primase